MVTNKAPYIIILLTICFYSSIAQQETQEIKIGDKLPNIFIENIINPSEEKTSLKEFNGDKLLIIDFWATWCIPCLQEMNFLDSLKNIYPDKFKILMVTYESENIVRGFLKEPNKTGGRFPNLVFAVNDTLLHKFFPHRGIPHNIWVDQNGTVKAITSGKEVTADNILKFDSVKLSVFKTKKDNLKFDPTEDVFMTGDSSFTYRSVIAPHLNGVYSSGAMFVSNKKMFSRYFGWNISILQHFYYAYTNFTKNFRYSLMEVNTRDSLKLFYPDRKVYNHLLEGSKYKNIEQWQDENTFTYDLSLPTSVSGSRIRDYMFNDLERQFNIKPRIEKRKTPCILVSKINGKKLKLAKGTDSEITIEQDFKLIIKNSKLQDLLNWLFIDFIRSEMDVPIPLVSVLKKSNDGYFDLELDFADQINDKVKAITAQMILEKLSHYGFQFKNKTIPYPILILEDLN